MNCLVPERAGWCVWVQRAHEKVQLHFPGCSSLFICSSQPFAVTHIFLWTDLPNVHISPAVTRSILKGPRSCQVPSKRERALEELQAWRHQKRGRLLSEMLSSTALLALHATLPRSSWSWMDSLLLFNSAVLLGSDGWGTVGQSHGWESHSPPSPLPGKFCELPRCFLKQGRKEDSNFSF